MLHYMSGFSQICTCLQFVFATRPMPCYSVRMQSSVPSIRYLNDRTIQLWLAALGVVVAAGLLMGASPPRYFDPFGSAVGSDYINIWAASRMIESGRADAIWNVPLFQEYIASQTHANYPIRNWSYPPTFGLLVIPFAYIPYEVGLFLWLALTFVPVLVAARGYGWTWGVVALVLLSPAGLWNIVAGQNGYLTAGLLALGLQARHSRSWLAAVCFALLTFKPHLGVIVPLLLICEKNWSVIAKTALLAGGWILLSLMMFGSYGWLAYLTSVREYQWQVISQWTGFVNYAVPTAWMAGRLAGIESQAVLWLLQGICSGAALFGALRIFTTPTATDVEKLVAVVLATLLIFPYLFVYDWVIFHVALMLWWRASKHHGAAVRVVLWLWPFLLFVLALMGWQITPLLLLLLLWQLTYYSRLNMQRQLS